MASFAIENILHRQHREDHGLKQQMCGEVGIFVLVYLLQNKKK